MNIFMIQMNKVSKLRLFFLRLSANEQ